MTNNTTTTTAATPPAAPASSSASGMFTSFAPLLLMLVAFYFLLMRPQQKREAKRRALIGALKRGDKVITASGIIGVVHKIISDKEISLEISEDVRVRVLKTSVGDVLESGSEIGKEETEIAKPEHHPIAKPATSAKSVSVGKKKASKKPGTKIKKA
jgi:preprotein translocase subunit YajC